MRKILLQISCIVVLFLVLWVGLQIGYKNSYPSILYSWKLEDVLEDRDKFNSILKEYHINILYQDFTSKYLETLDDTFIKEMNEKNITVYHLAGDPSWGTENGFLSIQKEIDKVILFNQKVSFKIKGIVLDIEPYISEKEERFAKKDFFIYVKQIEKTYAYLKDKDLELILAIPYWFDSIDEYLLETLIQNTDGISVMNYKITKTNKNIQNEIKLASKYDKKIDTAYEINYKDKDYFESREAILKDYQKIKKKNDSPNLGISFHHYGSIK